MPDAEPPAIIPPVATPGTQHYVSGIDGERTTVVLTIIGAANSPTVSASGTDYVPIFVLVMLAVPVWAIVDAARTPTEAFVAASSSKGMWITLIAAFTLFTGIIGTVLAIIYLVSIRPRVRATWVH